MMDNKPGARTFIDGVSGQMHPGRLFLETKGGRALSGAVIGLLLARKRQEEVQDSGFPDEGEMVLLYRWFKKLVVKIVADDIRRQGQIGLALRTP